MMQTYSAVGQCFDQKRPLASGIVITGGAVGAIAFPPLLQLLTDAYGLNGMALILAGVSTHYYLVTYLLFLVARETKHGNNDYKMAPKVVANNNEDEMSTLISKHSSYQSRSNLQTINDTTYCCSTELSASWVRSEDNHDDAANTRKPVTTRYCCQALIETLDLSVFLNSTFLVNSSASAIQSALSFETAIILLDFGEHEVGVSRLQAASLVSIMSAADLCGRFLTGVGLTYCKRCCPKIGALCVIVLVLNTGAYTCLGSARHYVVVAGCCVVVGLCYGTFRLIYFEVLASSQSPSKFPNALGLSEMTKASAVLATGPLVGRLRDLTGSYGTTFFVFAGLCLLASSLWILLLIFGRKSSRTEDTNDT